MLRQLLRLLVGGVFTVEAVAVTVVVVAAAVLAKAVAGLRHHREISECGGGSGVAIAEMVVAAAAVAV